MNKNILIVLLVVAVVGGVAWLKGRNTPLPPTTAVDAGRGATTSRPADANLPRLVELGAGQCDACKKMKPIIEEVAREFTGRATVEMLDVLAQAEEARQYDWRLIPCQIFFDAAGNEVWRHEGFLPKETIVARLKELGAN